MNRQRPRRPSLKIVRHAHDVRGGGFAFTVWNPFKGEYQAVNSFEEGLRRVDELAVLICQMWLQRHPKQDSLVDAPEPDGNEPDEWAEFRINATTYRSFDTRNFDRPGWTRAPGMAQAVEATCGKIGYTWMKSAA